MAGAKREVRGGIRKLATSVQNTREGKGSLTLTHSSFLSRSALANNCPFPSSFGTFYEGKSPFRNKTERFNERERYVGVKHEEMEP